MKGLGVSECKIIPHPDGDVLHGMKSSEGNIAETYFSFVRQNMIKAWKQHQKMTCRFVVPLGHVKFVFFNPQTKEKEVIKIGQSNYQKIILSPGIWYGFEGLDDTSNLIVNMPDMMHDPLEVNRASLDEFEIKFE